MRGPGDGLGWRRGAGGAAGLAGIGARGSAGDAGARRPAGAGGRRGRGSRGSRVSWGRRRRAGRASGCAGRRGWPGRSRRPRSGGRCPARGRSSWRWGRRRGRGVRRCRWPPRPARRCRSRGPRPSRRPGSESGLMCTVRMWMTWTSSGPSSSAATIRRCTSGLADSPISRLFISTARMAAAVASSRPMASEPTPSHRPSLVSTDSAHPGERERQPDQGGQCPPAGPPAAPATWSAG